MTRFGYVMMLWLAIITFANGQNPIRVAWEKSFERGYYPLLGLNSKNDSEEVGFYLGFSKMYEFDGYSYSGIFFEAHVFPDSYRINIGPEINIIGVRAGCGISGLFQDNTSGVTYQGVCSLRMGMGLSTYFGEDESVLSLGL